MAFVCAGDGHVWIFQNAVTVNNGIPLIAVEDTTGSAYNGIKKLPGIVTWDLTPDVEESTAIRTSSTAGKKVKPCSDSIEWSVDFSAALDPADWLYAYILEETGASTPLDPSLGRSCWMFLTWDVAYRDDPLSTHVWVTANSGGTPWEYDPQVTYDGSDEGIYVYGTFNPPGVNVDNDASDASVVDFSFNVSAGPYLPRTQTGLFDLWSASPDTNITD